MLGERFGNEISGAGEMISLRYEEYYNSPFFGWRYARSQTISIPADLPLNELNHYFKSVIDFRNEYEAISLTATPGYLLHLQDTCLVPICSYCCCMICCLCIFYDSLFESKGYFIGNGRSEINGTVNEIFIEQGMHLRYYKPRFRRGQHDIGVWTSRDDFLGFSLLQSTGPVATTTRGDANLTWSSKEFLSSSNSFSEIYICQTSSITNLIRHYHGREDASFHINFCPPEICQQLHLLRNLVEKSYHQASASHPSASMDLNDFKLTLSLEDLHAVIGKPITSQLLYYFANESFDESSPSSSSPPLQSLQQLPLQQSPSAAAREGKGWHVDEIILRRSVTHNQCIPFHTDFARRTMQISLNSSVEDQGGKLLYLSESRCVLPKREVGTIMIHGDDMVHGVTEMLCGRRYGLFFLQKR
jgi:hypothetical protein